MARGRKKAPPAPADHRDPSAPVPHPPAPATPAARLLTADAGGGVIISLREDAGRGLLVIAPDQPEKPAGLGLPALAVLSENGFAEEETGGAWVRPIDREASFQDRIDAERVLLKVAELLRGSRGTGRARL